MIAIRPSIASSTPMMIIINAAKTTHPLQKALDGICLTSLSAPRDRPRTSRGVSSSIRRALPPGAPTECRDLSVQGRRPGGGADPIGLGSADAGDKGVMMSTSSTVEVFVAMYDTEDGAGAALKDFKGAQRAGAIDLIDAAVIVHKAEGKVKFDETADPTGKRWAKRGAIAGGLVGLIFPPSIIVAGAGGAGAGGLWGKGRGKGVKDEDLREIGESLPPGSSAIIAVAEDRVVADLERSLSGYEKIAKHLVSAEAAAAIIAEVDDEEAETKS